MKMYSEKETIEAIYFQFLQIMSNYQWE